MNSYISLDNNKTVSIKLIINSFFPLSDNPQDLQIISNDCLRRNFRIDSCLQSIAPFISDKREAVKYLFQELIDRTQVHDFIKTVFYNYRNNQAQTKSWAELSLLLENEQNFSVENALKFTTQKFRVQSLLVHPDKNPSDNNATEKFQTLVSAHEALQKIIVYLFKLDELKNTHLEKIQMEEMLSSASYASTSVSNSHVLHQHQEKKETFVPKSTSEVEKKIDRKSISFIQTCKKILNRDNIEKIELVAGESEDTVILTFNKNKVPKKQLTELYSFLVVRKVHGDKKDSVFKKKPSRDSKSLNVISFYLKSKVENEDKEKYFDTVKKIIMDFARIRYKMWNDFLAEGAIKMSELYVGTHLSLTYNDAFASSYSADFYYSIKEIPANVLKNYGISKINKPQTRDCLVIEFSSFFGEKKERMMQMKRLVNEQCIPEDFRLYCDDDFLNFEHDNNMANEEIHSGVNDSSWNSATGGSNNNAEFSFNPTYESASIFGNTAPISPECSTKKVSFSLIIRKNVQDQILIFLKENEEKVMKLMKIKIFILRLPSKAR